MISIILLIPVIIGYIFGWDAAGLFYGYFRNIIIDSLIVIHTILTLRVLFQKKNFKFYMGMKRKKEETQDFYLRFK